MTYKISVKPSDHTFTAEDGETILEAANKHGVTLPYSCCNGACGVCKGKVLYGHIDHGNPQAYALTTAEKAEGLALFCCAKPKSDLIIESREVKSESDIQVKTLPTRVEKIERLSDDVIALYLKLPASERMQFLAGQYIDILLKDDKPRSFSLANAPHDDAFLVLHIRHIPGGSFTHYVFNELKERDILRIKGPLGHFYLREDSYKPMIFVASGTGFAPVKALVEHALYSGIKRPMHVYWGGNKRADLYMTELAESWAQHGVRFTPVLSAPLPEDGWEGRTGFVHQAVMKDYPDLSGYQVYACGNPVMVESAFKDFTAQCGLPQNECFSDAFTFAPKS